MKIQESRSYPQVAIIVLNWNGWKDSIECLESIYHINYPRYSIIIIDNNSQDDSLTKIKEYASGNLKAKSKFFTYTTKNKPIKVIEYTKEELKTGVRKEKEMEGFPPDRKLILIKNDKNYGFTGANNIGARFAIKYLDADYVLFLNNDMVVDPNFLRELIITAENEDKVGLVGPVILFYWRPDDVHSRGGIINLRWGWNLVGGNLHKKKFKDISNLNLHYYSGSAFMLKRKIIEKIGLFDPDYFYYTEDVDLGYRIHKAGYKIVCAQKSKVWHKEGGSVGYKIDNPLTAYYYTRNAILFIRKHGEFHHKLIFIPVFLLKLIKEIILNYEREHKLIKSRINGIAWHFKH